MRCDHHSRPKLVLEHPPQKGLQARELRGGNGQGVENTYKMVDIVCVCLCIFNPPQTKHKQVLRAVMCD